MDARNSKVLRHGAAESYADKFVVYFPKDGKVLFASADVDLAVKWMDANGYGNAKTPEAAMLLPNLEYVPSAPALETSYFC